MDESNNDGSTLMRWGPVVTRGGARWFREPADAAGPAIRSLVIVGAGGFGREVLQYVRDAMALQSGYAVKGFLDDVPPDLDPFALDVPVLGGTHDYVFAPDERVLIAVGDPATRLALAARLETLGARFVTLVHPLAYVSEEAVLGAGCIVAPFATIGAHARIGDQTVLTFYASAGHDTTIGRGCGFSPHAVANGGSTLGEGVFLGAYAVVNPLQSVGAGSKVAAGSVVYHPIPPDVLAVGNPAKPRPLWKR